MAQPKKVPPSWLRILAYLTHKAEQDEWVTNEQMAKDIKGGYCARNYLTKHGRISQHGVKVLTDGPRRKGFVRYKLHPDSIGTAQAVLFRYR